MQNASTSMPRPRRRGGPRQHSQTVAGYSARSDTAACGIWLAATLLAGSIAAATGVVPTYDNGIVGLETCQGNTRVVDGDPLGRELNSVTREIMEELARVVQEAENRLQGLSTEEVEKIAQRDFARVFAMSGKLDGVVRELLERKLIAGYKRLDMPMLKKAR